MLAVIGGDGFSRSAAPCVRGVLIGLPSAVLLRGVQEARFTRPNAAACALRAASGVAAEHPERQHIGCRLIAPCTPSRNLSATRGA